MGLGSTAMDLWWFIQHKGFSVMFLSSVLQVEAICSFLLQSGCKPQLYERLVLQVCTSLLAAMFTEQCDTVFNCGLRP